MRKTIALLLARIMRTEGKSGYAVGRDALRAPRAAQMPEKRRLYSWECGRQMPAYVKPVRLSKEV